MQLYLGSDPVELLDGRCVLHCGDVIDRLRQMPDESFDTVVTAPPVWGQVDCGTGRWSRGDRNCRHELEPHFAPHNRRFRGICKKCGAVHTDIQIGLEPSLSSHISILVEVFAEIWRVLKPHGTVWLNYGDAYATTPNGQAAAVKNRGGVDDRLFNDKPMKTIGPLDHLSPNSPKLKGKDLCMIPNRLAIALQEWGWWVRAEIIWGKPNARPDTGGNGRPSSAHEKIFMLAKSDRADVWRARDNGAISTAPDLTETCDLKAVDANGMPRTSHRWIRVGSYYDASEVRQPTTAALQRMARDIDDRETRLLRNFEPAPLTAWEVNAVSSAGGQRMPATLAALCLEAACPPRDGVVLDPFAGFGTTALVALRMGRKAVLIDVNPAPLRSAAERIADDWMGEDAQRYKLARKRHPSSAGPLFALGE